MLLWFATEPAPNATELVTPALTLALKPTAVLLPLLALIDDWLPIAMPLVAVASTKAAPPAPPMELPPIAIEFAALACVWTPIAVLKLPVAWLEAPNAVPELLALESAPTAVLNALSP